MKKIAVMLPVGYRGGSLRAAKNIAKAIAMGAQQRNIPVQVVFSYVRDSNYDVHTDFLDLTEMGISIRETVWQVLNRDTLDNMFPLLVNRTKKLPYNQYSLPVDGANDFNDCDLWIIISDRLLAPVLPLRNYICVVFDYLQRYVPNIFGGSEQVWNLQEDSYFPTVRNAQSVFVTTPSTQNDMIAYCGIPKEKIHLINMDFSPVTVPSSYQKEKLKYNYFLWPSNASAHKNHVNTIKGIQKYFEENKELDCVISGVNTVFFQPDYTDKNNEHIINHYTVKNVRDLIRCNPILKKRLHIVGEVSDVEYANLIKNAKFVLHSNVNDNGTFCVIEAAYLGTPSLSSRYPAMEFINKHFNLNMNFFDPFNSNSISDGLKMMQYEYSNIKLPSPSDLEKYSWQSSACRLFDLINPYLEMV